MTVEKMSIKVKIGENAQKPTKSGVGYILHASQSVTIKPKTKQLISSGISMVIPNNYYGQLHVLDKHVGDLKLLAGVIDSDYRGNIFVSLYNESDNNYNVSLGDPICKIIFVKINTSEIEYVNSLEDSERGLGSFGSTGK